MGSMRERMVWRHHSFEELAGLGGRTVLPELLEGLFEKVSANGLQVIPEQLAQAEALLLLQILFALEQEPSRLL
jgi:hypothetical protein